MHIILHSMNNEYIPIQIMQLPIYYQKIFFFCINANCQRCELNNFDENFIKHKYKYI